MTTFTTSEDDFIDFEAEAFAIRNAELAAARAERDAELFAHVTKPRVSRAPQTLKRLTAERDVLKAEREALTRQWVGGLTPRPERYWLTNQGWNDVLRASNAMVRALADVERRWAKLMPELEKSQRINGALERDRRNLLAHHRELRVYRAPKWADVEPHAELLILAAFAEWDCSDGEHDAYVTLCSQLDEAIMLAEDLAFDRALSPNDEGHDDQRSLAARKARQDRIDDEYRTGKILWDESAGREGAYISVTEYLERHGENTAAYREWLRTGRYHAERTGPDGDPRYVRIATDRRLGPADAQIEDTTDTGANPVMIASQRPAGWNVDDAAKLTPRKECLDREAAAWAKAKRDEYRDYFVEAGLLPDRGDDMPGFTPDVDPFHEVEIGAYA